MAGIIDDKWQGLQLNRLAPAGTPPVLTLTLNLDADLRICSFNIEACRGAEPFSAAMAAYRLGIQSIMRRPPPAEGKSDGRASDH